MLEPYEHVQERDRILELAAPSAKARLGMSGSLENALHHSLLPLNSRNGIRTLAVAMRRISRVEIDARVVIAGAVARRILVLARPGQRPCDDGLRAFVQLIGDEEIADHASCGHV